MSHRPLSMLVTGGAGFIGANFLKEVLGADPELHVVTVDKLTYAGDRQRIQDLPQDRHRFVHGDICDSALVGGLLRQHAIDTIVHLAAESHVDRSIAGPSPFIETNVVGTFTLLEEARRFWLQEQGGSGRSVRFHHVSTDEVYGSLGPHDPPFSEATRYDPRSPYSASKASSDHLVRAYHHTYGLDVTLSNCSNNYGPKQHDEKFIPVVIKSCIERRPIPVYGDGSNIRDWIFVGDHCRALRTVITKASPGETINIGGDDEQPNIEVARRICRVMDEHMPWERPHESLITFVADRPGHDWRYAVDSTRLKQRYGWRPRRTFTAGIRETVAWYLDRWA